MNKTKRCSHCTGAMVTHITWGPLICISCGREEEHRKQGPTTCSNCITVQPINIEELKGGD